MKKIILSSLFLGIICNLLLSQVYTPNGTVVEAHTLSAGDVALFEAQAAGWLADHNLTDSVQRVGAATREYNCHSFAWNISEGGNNVWVNAFLDSDYNSFNPYNSNSIPPLPQNISKYWDDGSYIQVSNESLASKVWYGSCWTWTIYGWSNNCDHSAVRLSSGLYKSKWGAWPLYIHAYNNCPYTWSNRKYYIKRLSLSGPRNICGQGTYTYTINLPNNIPVSWSASSDIRIVSEQNNSVTVERNPNTDYMYTDSYIVADVGEPYNSSYERKDIITWKQGSIRTTDLIDISSSPDDYGQPYIYTAQLKGDLLYRLPRAPEWWVSAGLNLKFDDGTMIRFTSNSLEGEHIMVRLTNPCGENLFIHHVFGDQSGYYSSFTLTPNPATDVVTVRLNETETPQTTWATQSLSKTAASPGVYEIQLWSAGAMIRSYKTDRSAFEMPVSGLPAGIYFVCVVKEGKTCTEKLIKK